MADYKAEYLRWSMSPVVDEETKRELGAIADNEKEIEERFYRELEFGTGGMRGILGAGTNRMNIYTVRRASQGVAKYVLGLGADKAKAGVLIGYDTRNFSRVFAEETARVLAANGVKAYLFDKVHSVPEVSFGVRELGCAAGVMITASHNPKEYNGYKVYGGDGCQLPPDGAAVVLDAIGSFDIFDDIRLMCLEDAQREGLVEIVGEEQDKKFIEAIKKQQMNPDAVTAVADTFKLIYTPFHGTGSRPVQTILKEMGFQHVLVVKEQDTEDGNFPTVKSPNPEEKEGFTIAIEMAKENDVDLIIGTDPDCDRVGIVVRDKDGVYQTMTGNQTGALLTEYILASRKAAGTLPENGVVIKTIVTTELAAEIARAYGAAVVDVLTGFKYIGEKMTEYDRTKQYTYLFGFEESYGCLPGTYARDKDGVAATMLIAEMAAWYKTKNMSLYEAMQEIYQKYGYYYEHTVSFTMPGKDGMEKMAALMQELRDKPPAVVHGMDVVSCADYKTQKIITQDGAETPIEGLPKSDVLKYDLSDGKTYFIVRPSGTEPKIKIYLASSKDSMAAAEQTVADVLEDLKKQLAL